MNADRAVVRRDANPTESNVNRAERAAATAERHADIVSNQERQVELAQWRTQIPTGATDSASPVSAFGHTSRPLASPGGEVGNSTEGARQAVNTQAGEDDRRSANNAAYDQRYSGNQPPAAEPTRNAQGHIQLPAPPGNLTEISDLDSQISELQDQIPSQRQLTTEAREQQTAARTQSVGISTAATEVTARVNQNTQRSAAEQQRINAQTTDITTRTTTAQGTATGGTAQATGPLSGIASAARTVDGLLQRIPSNRFFDISSAKTAVHRFVEGMDMITGAPAGQTQSAAQTNAAVTQRNSQVQEAQTTNAAATSQSTTLTGNMTRDASIAANAASQRGEIAAESLTQEQQLQQRLQQAQQQRTAKWAALMQWATQHRALRAQVLPADQL